MSRLGNCLYILAFLIIFASTAEAGSVWKITSLNWQPYSDSTMPSQGNSIQKLRNLLKKEGIDLIVEFYPWARAQEIANQEGYVGYFPAWPEEVAEGFTASLPVDWSEIGVLTHMHSGVKWTSLEALFEHKVGLVSHYTYPEFIFELTKTKPQNVDFIPNELSLLRMLSIKRIQVGITDPTVMHYLAAREGIDNIETLHRLMKMPLVLAFKNSPENLKLIKVLNNLLQQ